MTYQANPDRYNNMPYRRCGKSGLLLPALSLGLWHNFGAIDDLENARSILKTAFDNLEFVPGSAVIKEASYNSLNDLAGLLVKKAEWKIQISGHTDNVGNDQSNLILSKKRAEAVKAYLSSKNVANDRIQTLFSILNLV